MLNVKLYSDMSCLYRLSNCVDAQGVKSQWLQSSKFAIVGQLTYKDLQKTLDHAHASTSIIPRP